MSESKGLVTREAQVVSVSAKAEWEALKEQSTYAFQSGLLPRAIDTPQKAVTVALMGKDLGISPMQSLMNISVVNGMPVIKAQLMLRLIYERVPGARITVLTPPEMAAQICEVEMQRPGNAAQKFTFSIEDAKKAGFTSKDVWQKHTSTMIRWAAIRTGARIVFPDAIAGCYMDDEVPHHETKVPPEPPLIQPVTIISTDGPKLAAAKSLEERVAHANELLVKHGAPPMPEEHPRDVAKPTPQSAGPHTTDVVPENSRTTDVVPPNLRLVTEKQVNRLMAIARDCRWKRMDLKKYCEMHFGKSTGMELTRDEYDKTCNFIMEHPYPENGLGPTVEEMISWDSQGDTTETPA